MVDLHLGAHEGVGTNVPTDFDDPASPSSPLDQIRSGLKVWANVGATLGTSLDQHTATMQRYLRRLETNTPIDYAAQASGAFPATGFLVLNFGTPDQGTRWEVTSCILGGTDQDVTAAGSAGLYVAGYLPPNNGTSPGLAQLADRASTLPNVAFYGTRQLIVNDQEYLFAIIKAGTTGQTYVGNVSMTVFNIASAGGKDVNIL